MCCFPLGFSDVVVKVMRDGDGDGKCQEENGKWVPCPPGVTAGTRLRNGKPLGQTIADLASSTSATPTSSADPGDEYMRTAERINFREWLAARGTPYRDLNWREISPLEQQFNESLAKETSRRQAAAKAKLLKESPELFDEDGNLRPEVADQYVLERRAKAARRADEIERQAKTQISPESKEAARNITTPVEPDEYELRNQYEFDNPRPQREDFDEDSEGEAQFRAAIQDWNYDRDEWVSDEINETGNFAANMEYEIGKAFGHTMIGKDGRTYRSRVTGSSWDPYEGLAIAGEIYDAESGRIVGEFNRTLYYGGYNDKVYHASLSIDEDHQSLGLASQFNAMNELIYREMGIDTIDVTGASSGTMNGATHWPAVGFNWEDEYAKQDFLDEIENAIKLGAVQDPIENLILQELLQSARDGGNLVAGDFVRWKGAKEYFQDRGLSFGYRRFI